MRRKGGDTAVGSKPKVAEQAGVKRLALFHHDPEHNDAYLLNMEKECQKRFPDAFLAKEGEVIEL